MSKLSELNTMRERVLADWEKRRRSLGLSMRQLSLKAGLHPDYYNKLIKTDGGIQFPTVPRQQAIENTLNRLERVKDFDAKLQRQQEAGDKNASA